MPSTRRLLCRVAEAVTLLVSTLVYLLTIIINGLTTMPPSGVALVQSDMKNISDVYFTQITPGAWAFSIWGFIYTWQALWHLYAWTFVIREFWMPNYPRPISALTYVFFAASCVPNFVWVILWGNWLIIPGLVVVVFVPLILYLAIGASLWRTYQVTSELLQTKWGKVDLWLTRILVHNGLAFYATWVSIAWLLSVAIIADKKYFGAMSAVDAGTLSLSLLLVEVVVWCVLEHTILYRFARYIQSVYIVLIVGVSGIVSEHWYRTNEEDRNHHFALGILIVVLVLQILKIILTIVFAFVRPVKFPESKKEGKDNNKMNVV